jgi:hypothetical protein
MTHTATFSPAILPIFVFVNAAGDFRGFVSGASAGRAGFAGATFTSPASAIEAARQAAASWGFPKSPVTVHTF